MSTTFDAFWTELSRSPEIQANIRTLGPDMTPEQVVNIASTHGFDIGVDDLTDLRVLPDQELSDEDLDHIAGGSQTAQRSCFQDLRDISLLPDFPALMQMEYVPLGP